MKLTLRLKPFSVPNYVVIEAPAKPRQEGFRPEENSFPLSEVEASELSDMCDLFRAKVFQKAEKKDPREV
jgi:hypothetical protein